MARLSEADVFIVVTPGRADAKAMFASALRGACQISPRLLVHGRGTAVKMVPQSHLPKVLFVSKACVGTRKDVVALACRLVSYIPNYKWGVQHARWGDLKSKVSKSDLYATVCPGDVGQFTGHNNTFTLDASIKRVCKVDGEKSVSGLV